MIVDTNLKQNNTILHEKSKLIHMSEQHMITTPSRHTNCSEILNIDRKYHLKVMENVEKFENNLREYSNFKGDMVLLLL